MKKKISALILSAVCTLCAVCVLAGCGEENKNTEDFPSEENLKELEENKCIQLFGFEFEYEFAVPGAYAQCAYNYLWDGYSIINNEADSTDRSTYTYLTEYFEDDGIYYLVYLKKNLFEVYGKTLKTYEEANAGNSANYHFSNYDSLNIIDGKYLFACQQSGDGITDDIKFYTAESLSDIPYEYSDYRLCFCAKSKKAVIEENLSASQKINKKITLYCSEALIFENENSAPSLYAFSGEEKKNREYSEELFNYVGEMIEAYPLNYSDIDYSYYPMLGTLNVNFSMAARAKVIIEDEKKYFLLPRYGNESELSIDLFDGEENFYFTEDVFGKHKEEFKQAYVKDSDYKDEDFVFALYDYEQVIKIIKEG